MRIEIGQIISQILSFLIMYWVLNRYGWQPLLKVLNDRREKIKEEFKIIEEEKQAAQRFKEHYHEKVNELNDQVQSTLHDAKEKGQAIAFEIEQSAHMQARKILQKAQEDAQNELVKAKKQLKNDIVNLAMEATKKIVPLSLDQNKQNELITEFVNQVELK